MQVYVVVCNLELDLFLITKKNVVNRFWEGQLSATDTVVNQAGQYALPGGRIEATETPQMAGSREFLEETGVDLGKFAGTWGEEFSMKDEYTALLYEVEPGTLFQLEILINQNISQRNVTDLEHECVVLVGGGAVTQYLGVKVSIPTNFVQAVADETKARQYSQSITWYAAIAVWLAKLTK